MRLIGGKYYPEMVKENCELRKAAEAGR